MSFSFTSLVIHLLLWREFLLKLSVFHRLDHHIRRFKILFLIVILLPSFPRSQVNPPSAWQSKQDRKGWDFLFLLPLILPHKSLFSSLIKGFNSKYRVREGSTSSRLGFNLIVLYLSSLQNHKSLKTNYIRLFVTKCWRKWETGQQEEQVRPKDLKKRTRQEGEWEVRLESLMDRETNRKSEGEQIKT